MHWFVSTAASGWYGLEVSDFGLILWLCVLLFWSDFILLNPIQGRSKREGVGVISGFMPSCLIELDAKNSS